MSIILSHPLMGRSFINISKFLYSCFNSGHFACSICSFINVSVILPSEFIVIINQPIIKGLLRLMILLLNNSALTLNFFILNNYLLILIIISFLQFTSSFVSHVNLLVHYLELNWIDHMIKLLVEFNRLVLCSLMDVNILLQHLTEAISFGSFSFLVFHQLSFIFGQVDQSFLLFIQILRLLSLFFIL